MLCRYQPQKICRTDKRLKVDIIAYQDEVGCVKANAHETNEENFAKLGEIHKETNIRFWANVESFTWEKRDNDRESALIPAAFPRYLSQITGVSAGAEEVISFSVYGIFDKPDSEMPIRQPCYSAKAYQDYMDWNSGSGQMEITGSDLQGERHS